MGFDLALLYFFHSLAGVNRLLDFLIVFIGSTLPYLVAAAVLILPFILIDIDGKQRLSKMGVIFYAFFSGVIARFGITEIIRFVYYRPRPFMALHFNPLIPHETSGSFPSGHAVFFFALAMSIWFYNKKFGWYLFGLTAIICLARVSAGVHWPSDIAGGAIIGILTSIGIEFLRKRISKKSKNES
ncbi:MAG: phosphatase PAP2 family protein [Candidatus Sungbacteria bacterium]|uniref:Phosphatase PAP2 family protein n=1 Tax=Candidatus Sungiibacteriota bacterium TaxID=2750080 RepID=A0A9D6QVQ9_9BACT|nr:phosphatase PAP2 family protein [Candidatus Sungbacteria bacterium]